MSRPFFHKSKKSSGACHKSGFVELLLPIWANAWDYKKGVNISLISCTVLH